MGPPDVPRMRDGKVVRVAVVAGATAVAVSVALSAALGMPFLAMLPRATAHAATMAALSSVLLPVVLKRLADAGSLFRWTAVVATLIGLPVVGTLVACAVLAALGLAPEPFRRSYAIGFPINAVLTALICGAMMLYESQRARVAELTLALRTRELEHEHARKVALEARLASLESRLHPHFLFNTLNAIAALVYEDPDRAERTVERLAALLRFSLDATAQGLVPLADELAIVRDYLEIERTRLGDRLAWAVDEDPALARWPIPALAVQTLVENSVKHAIASRPGGGRIHVRSAVDGERLGVTVWDDGPGFTRAALRPDHGLDTLVERLAARYGGGAALDIAPRDGGSAVTVLVPRLAPVPVTA